MRYVSLGCRKKNVSTSTQRIHKFLHIYRKVHSILYRVRYYWMWGIGVCIAVNIIYGVVHDIC